jgi:hypothetical protein
MKTALGVKAHSGWAALVALGASAGTLRVVDRRRLELVEPDEARWAKQPYHAARSKDSREAEAMVERAIRSARRLARRELRAAVERVRAAKHDVVGCAVLAGAPMPAWSVAEILAVHVRMHKAEGALFREALASAADGCGLTVVMIPERELAAEAHASETLAAPRSPLRDEIAALGKTLGPPWGRDQKDAALAAWIALSKAN